MPGYVKGLTHGRGQGSSEVPLHIQPLYALGQRAAKQHTWAQAKMTAIKNDFFISARYRLIRLLLAADLSKNQISRRPSLFTPI